MSLVVKFGALIFIVFLPTQFAIYLQLLGGILIIQTLPAVMLGVYTRWFNDWALLIGWAVGMATGTAMFVAVNTPNYPLVIARLYPARLCGDLQRHSQSRGRGGADAGVQRAARRQAAGRCHGRGGLCGVTGCSPDERSDIREFCFLV